MIATDGNSGGRTGRTDGVWALKTEGSLRGTGKLFFRCPVGAEMWGPEFTPDDETLFVAVQHPGEADEGDANAPPATFENPATRQACRRARPCSPSPGAGAARLRVDVAGDWGVQRAACVRSDAAAARRFARADHPLVYHEAIQDHGQIRSCVFRRIDGCDRINPFEEGLLLDLKDALRRLVPATSIINHGRNWKDDNAHSHLRATLLGPQLMVPVSGGSPDLAHV